MPDDGPGLISDLFYRVANLLPSGQLLYTLPANTTIDRAMEFLSGHWNLLRYDPRRLTENKNPLQLDSKQPSVPYKDFLSTETRFSMLFRTDSAKAQKLLHISEKRNHDRYFHYQQLARISYPESDADDAESAD